MKFHELSILSQPAITYAKADVSESHATLQALLKDPKKAHLILALNTGADCTIKTVNDTLAFPANSIAAFLPTETYNVTPNSAESESSFFITCTHIKSFRYKTTLLEDDAPFLPAENQLLLPTVLPLNKSQLQTVSLFMQTMSHHKNHPGAAEDILCLSLWYRTLGMLDMFLRSHFPQNPIGRFVTQPGADYYVYKAKKLIHEHYAEKLSLPHIAGQLGITPNYLSSVFKKGTGETVITYINRYRMERLLELLHENNAKKLEDICQSVGIHDKRYAQRLSKRFYSLSIQGCMQIDHSTVL